MPIRREIKRPGFRSVGLMCFLVLSSLTAAAQYLDNLKDVDTSQYTLLKYWPVNRMATRRPTPIGNLGDVQTIIDLRGFVPMSLASRPGWWRMTLADNDDWFKVPTKTALLMLYYGNLDIADIDKDTTNLQSSFARTTLLQESELKGDSDRWAQVAYRLASNSYSASLFENLAGDGFQAAEPTTVFFTPQSAFIILSFKYESTLVHHGQLLVAFEFSRSSKRFKTFYPVYSTELMSKSGTATAVAVAPYVAKAVAAYFSQGN